MGLEGPSNNFRAGERVMPFWTVDLKSALIVIQVA